MQTTCYIRAVSCSTTFLGFCRFSRKRSNPFQGAFSKAQKAPQMNPKKRKTVKNQKRSEKRLQGNSLRQKNHQNNKRKLKDLKKTQEKTHLKPPNKKTPVVLLPETAVIFGDSKQTKEKHPKSQNIKNKQNKINKRENKSNKTHTKKPKGQTKHQNTIQKDTHKTKQKPKKQHKKKQKIEQKTSNPLPPKRPGGLFRQEAMLRQDLAEASHGGAGSGRFFFFGWVL